MKEIKEAFNEIRKCADEAKCAFIYFIDLDNAINKAELLVENEILKLRNDNFELLNSEHRVQAP